MNTLKIKLNPYKDVNIASLDDKPLSPYSELNNYMKEPFLKWADKLLGAAEREINDDYQLVVSGEDFETKMLQDMQNDFDACKSYSVEPYQVNSSVHERFALIKELATKYGVQVQLDNFRMPIYSEVELRFDETMVCQAAPESASLYLTENPSFANQILAKNGPAIVILVSNKSAVTAIGDMKYQWEIEANRLNEIVEITLDRFVKIPIITYVANQLKNIAAQLTDEDNQKLALATEIDMFISVADVEPIEVGTSRELVVRTVPESDSVPALRIECSNTSVIVVDGMSLSAVAPGQVYIDIYKADELIPFVRKQVVATQDNSVKKIELSLVDGKMGIGRSQSVAITLFPADADDASLVEWTSSNNDVVAVDEDGKITAVSAGRAVIKAATPRVSEQVEVEVLPNLSSITLSTTRVELFVGETNPIDVSVSPANAFDSSYEWQTSNKSVAIIDKLDDGSQIIRATGIGECVLTCVAKEGNCSATCSAKVESTFKRQENIHTFLSYTAIAAVACLVFAVLSIKIGVLISAGVTVLAGITAIGKNKKDFLWSVVLIGFSAFLALLSLGILSL